MEIHKFSELSDLKNMIEEDFESFSLSAQRFPVRFIFLNSHDELKEVMDLMIGTATKIELSSFLSRDDGWLTPNDIIKNIKNLDENSVIVPLSEFIRFLDNKKFKSVFSSLAEIENKPFRIYVPLVGLWDRFEDLFYNKFYRYENWAPIWRLKSDNKSIKIYQIAFDFNKDIKTNDLRLVSNTKEWLELWKQDDFDEIISTVRPLLVNFHNSLPDQTFTQDVIYTQREYLSKIHGIDLDIVYDELDNDFWDNLLIYISQKNLKNISFKNIFADIFNISHLSKLGVEDYLNLYLSNINNQFKQWLVKNFVVLSKDFNNTYLGHCFKSMEKLGNNNLARKIYLEIFKLKNESYLEERRLLLKNLNKYELSFAENDFEIKFKNIEDLNYKQQFKYLTTTTSVEKSKMLEIIHNNGLDNIISDLKVIFPELYYYLDWNFTLNEDAPYWVLKYFKEYNKSKVLNFKSEKLDDLLIENNRPDKFYEWYFKFSKTSSLDNSDNNYIIWIDALGTEWLPLLTYSLNYYGKPHNKKVKFKTINSVNLPSATEFNKKEYDLKISNLDEYIHKNHYTYPKSLLDEIESIKQIAKTIVKIDSPKITIVSDHGFSFLCTKEFGGFKKYKFKDSKHEGRYLNWENKEDVVDEDYMSIKSQSLNHEQQKFLVPLRHISLNNTPSHEVHGGATPEEVLVPYIVLENDDVSLVEYEIVALNPSVNVSKETELRITMSPQPHSLPIVICNSETLPISKDKNQYIIQLNSNLNKGMQKFIVKIDDEEVGEVEINIKKGGMEEEDYGGLFG